MVFAFAHVRLESAAESGALVESWMGALLGGLPPGVWDEVLDARVSPVPWRAEVGLVRGPAWQRLAVSEVQPSRRRLVSRRWWPLPWESFESIRDWSLSLSALDGEGRVMSREEAGGFYSWCWLLDCWGTPVLQIRLRPGEEGPKNVYPCTGTQWLVGALREIVTAGPVDFAAVTQGADVTGFEEITAGNGHSLMLAAREVARGYEWVTVLAEPLVQALGGAGRLRESGAFWDVGELPDGGVFLQATQHPGEYTPDRVRAVFDVLQPVLPNRELRPSAIYQNPWVLLDRTGLAKDPSPPFKPWWED